MPDALRIYVRVVEKVGYIVGRATMYSIFVMMAVLLYSSIMKTFFLPSLWTLETAQFLMMAYFLLGGAYALQLGSHVRMDLLYGTWNERRRARVDCVTILFLITFLIMLLYGGISSTTYALEYGERSYSAWRPYMAPIKIVMVFGILLTLLQAIALLIRKIAWLKGEDWAELPKNDASGA